jgi:hypothetical protein
VRSTALLAFGILTASVLPAPGQPPVVSGGRSPEHRKDTSKEGRYVPFPFDRDVEALVNGQLATMEQLQPYKDFVTRMLRDPKKIQFDAAELNQLNLKDPRVQKTLDAWMKKSNGKPPTLPEELEKLKADIRNSGAPPAEKDIVRRAAEAPSPVAPPPAADDREAAARDWLKGALENAEDSRMGQWLRQSPAWQKAVADLKWSPQMPAPKTGSWRLDKLLGRGFTLDRLPRPDGAALERLGRLKPPDLSRWTPTLPAMPRPTLPDVSTPSLPSASGLGTLALWLLAVGLIALAVWQTSRWLKLGERKNRAAAATLGPWPVDPALVATRMELVRAFDYLALLILGSPARSWHHRAIARALAKRAASQAEFAEQLGLLYEAARYTEGAEVLPADQRDRARHALTQLAGVTPT